MPSYPATGLRPMFKWTGGKRRELPYILPHVPPFTLGDDEWTFVEPFVGGGAVFFALGHSNSVINDADEELINFYEVASVQDKRFLKAIEDVAGLFGKDKRSNADRDKQAAAYYEYRNLDRDNGLAGLPAWKRAARFFIVNQLAFAGMRRFNSSGEFNIPFGHYKSFNTDVLTNSDHIDLLRSASITCGSYETVLQKHDRPNTFIFLDPPYTRVMKKYSADAPFGDNDQRKLAERVLGLEHASWMLVIDRSPLTEELYGDHIVTDYELSYGVNIKNRFDQASVHILATNYQTASGDKPPILQVTKAA